MGGTNYGDSQTIDHHLTNAAGNFILVRCATASIPSAAAGYAVGCLLEDTTTGVIYKNTGSTTSCTFTQAASGVGGQQTVAVTTNGSSNVNVFGSTNGFTGTIKGAWLVAVDGTAANITLTNGGTTVTVIAKGTTATVVVGATSVANTSITASGTFVIASSVAAGGQAVVFIVYSA